MKALRQLGLSAGIIDIKWAPAAKPRHAARSGKANESTSTHESTRYKNGDSCTLELHRSASPVLDLNSGTLQS